MSSHVGIHSSTTVQIYIREDITNITFMWNPNQNKRQPSEYFC